MWWGCVCRLYDRTIRRILTKFISILWIYGKNASVQRVQIHAIMHKRFHMCEVCSSLSVEISSQEGRYGSGG